MTPIINAGIDLSMFVILYLIVSLSLNLQYGYAGIPNFGIAASVAIGAYSTSLVNRLIGFLLGADPSIDMLVENWRLAAHINGIIITNPYLGILVFFFTILVGLLIGAAIGFAMTIPAVRLKSDYLLIVMIAMAEAVRLIGINYFPLAGGTSGFSIFNPFIWLGGSRTAGLFLVYTLITIALYIVMSKITHSPFGRLLRANRDSEPTASSIGKNPINVKLTAMVVGSMIATMAGVLFTFYISASVPPAYTRTDWTFWPWLMVMIGGRGNNKGAAVGAVAVVTIRRMSIIGKHSLAAFLPFDVTWLENIVLGICLIIMIAFKPKGLIPEKPIGILDREKRLEYSEKISTQEAEV